MVSRDEGNKAAGIRRGQVSRLRARLRLGGHDGCSATASRASASLRRPFPSQCARLSTHNGSKIL